MTSKGKYTLAEARKIFKKHGYTLLAKEVPNVYTQLQVLKS